MSQVQEPARVSEKKTNGAQIPAPTPQIEEKSDLFTSIWLRFSRFGWDVAGVGLIAFALITLIGFLSRQELQPQGILLALWVDQVSLAFGWGWPLVVIAFAMLGLLCLRKQFAAWPVFKLGRILALEGAAFCTLTLLSIYGGFSLDRAAQGLDGGAIGWALATRLDRWVPVPWGTVLVAALLALFTAYGFGLIQWAFHRLGEWVNTEPGSFSAVNGNGSLSGQTGAAGKQADQPEDDSDTVGEPSPGISASRSPILPPYNLLLDDQLVRPDDSFIEEMSGRIEHTLNEFGLPVRVVNHRIGPTVTQFGVEPLFIEKPGPDGEIIRQKVRVSQISALSRDLALALSAERLRIEAPVPGRSYVGIEVPNRNSSLVRLRSLMECEEFTRLASPLSIALGRDVSGQPVVADLARMPHLLIAGTTGSGKSICIAAIATCLVMNNTPGSLRIAMLDPKMVELVRFNGLPHLLGKVETEVDRMLGVLRWAIVEMERRYRLLEEGRSRDIITYNRKMEKRGKPGLPRIVIIIDELADLMMTAPDQTEHSLIRLAQMARAVGIHLVVATQRPSTDVVTGLIKANFPARLAFTVASSIDSRVILDTNGAESLLGRGDMLFLSPEVGTPVRAQGALVSDDEITRVIDFWEKAAAEDPSLAAGEEAAPWEDLIEAEGEADSDKLVEQAIEIVRQSQRASTSLLQRRLRIGYPRAARLMDELEELGVVGPSQGGGREREVLLSPNEETFAADAGKPANLAAPEDSGSSDNHFQHDDGEANDNEV
ncbi:MAG: hypothetical protein GX491_08915 [Chloroflexi bacterium]|nr:hypothetical protein [Chloroflexota bacterium]